MFEPDRRRAIGMGLAGTVFAALRPEDAPAREAPVTPAPPKDVAARLATLRGRPRHLGPPSPALVAALRRIPRPVLVYDLDQVEENYLSFLAARPGVSVHYAVKSCPNPRVMRRVAAVGGGFDVASRGEVDLALDAGAPPARCVFSNTVKHAADIQYAFEKGVTAFVADSEREVRKQAKHAPGSNLYVRLLVTNKDAGHPLGDKFGTTPENAKRLLKLGKDLGLKPFGTHFHVGTQCYAAAAWEQPAAEAASVFRDLKKDGIDLTFFDIGGGFPAPYLGKPIPSVSDIFAAVDRVLKRELPGQTVTLAVEPGRGIAATAGALSCRLMLRAPRASGEWLHLDAGVFHGLFGAIGGTFEFPVSVPGRGGPPAAFTLCGPTCDSDDVVAKDRPLPSGVTEGDLFVFDHVGAYSECVFTRFNGIAPPAVHYLDELL